MINPRHRRSTPFPTLQCPWAALRFTTLLRQGSGGGLPPPLETQRLTAHVPAFSSSLSPLVATISRAATGRRAVDGTVDPAAAGLVGGARPPPTPRSSLQPAIDRVGRGLDTRRRHRRHHRSLINKYHRRSTPFLTLQCPWGQHPYPAPGPPVPALTMLKSASAQAPPHITTLPGPWGCAACRGPLRVSSAGRSGSGLIQCPSAEAIP
jgi:hypothetical protein